MKRCNTITGLLVLLCVSAGYTQPAIGNRAPEISLIDINGIVQNLSETKRMIVLVDFWASWCVPCRRSNRELLPLYKKYKNKGFEIFAISIDQNLDDWKKAIKADKIKWKQVVDAEGLNGPAVTSWGIEQLPTSYLLDKEGIIIAIDPAKKDIEKYLKKSLH